MLATGAGAVAPHATARRYAAALSWGGCATALLMVIAMGVRPDLSEAARLPMFWVKIAFPACLAAGALYAAGRLSRPGGRLGKAAPAALAAPVVGMWVLAAFVLLAATAGERKALLFGSTWGECLLSVAVLSLPVFVAAMWAMKGLAPTRLALAGAAAGLLAGATGALIYALHCPEMQAPFLATWYLLGMLIPTGIGAFAGPRLLRW